MKRLFALFSITFSIQLSAQFSNNWMIGNSYGLNFSTTIPTVTTSALSSHPDNSSTISDASGNLLFYTNGVTVWNKNHVVMTNGNGLTGSYTGGQCALIVPIPCDPNRYVIFHTTEFASPGYLSYSVVDMSLSSGLGDVVSGQKNISLGSGWTEKLCAYFSPSANCFWVLSHKWMSNQFVAFKVDASSIATTSVTSSIGSIHNCGSYGGAHDAMGQLTISPDGTKVINAMTCQDKFEIFDFNSATGVLSNSIAIPGNTGNAWGTAFSPDSKKIYVNSIFGANVYQYDISIFNSTSILASLTSIYNTGSSAYNFGYMELGPDGKIYMPRPNTGILSIVNSPNLLGTACNFSYTGLTLSTGMAQWGLSRIAYNIPASYTSTPFTLSSVTGSATCNGMANGSATITPSNPGSYNYLWSPGSYTTSNPTSLSAGSYTVSVNNGSCSSSSTVITIIEPQPITVAVDPLTICFGNPGSLNSIVSGGTPAYTYSWSNGANAPGIVVSPSVTTTYTLNILDANGCFGTGVTTVSVSFCTGIQLNSNESEISVYPNPFNEKIYIKLNSVIDEVIITDIAGRVALQTELVNESIATGTLPNGMYFVTVIKSDKSVGSKKLIKSD